MWAGSVLVRIGEQRDLLVAIEADTDDTLTLLRTLLEPWLDEQPVVAQIDITPVFGVRLTSGASTDHGTNGAGPDQRSAGPRSVPQLRHGSNVIARSRQPDDIVRALAGVLGGAHVWSPDEGRPWIGLRPFVSGSTAMLVDLAPPAMVNDPRLTRLGISELPTWFVLVEAGGVVSVPPPLSDLAWQAIGVEPPAKGWQQYQLAGIAALRPRSYSAAELVVDLAARHHPGPWLTTVLSSSRDGLHTCVTDRSALRAHLRASLGE